MTEKGFFYTNSAAVGFTGFDFTLVFQRRSISAGVTPVPGTQNTAVVAELDVVSSPGHVKVLAAALLDSVLAFEQQFGPIRLNDDDSRKYEGVMHRLIAPRSTKQ